MLYSRCLLPLPPLFRPHVCGRAPLLLCPCPLSCRSFLACSLFGLVRPLRGRALVPRASRSNMIAISVIGSIIVCACFVVRSVVWAFAPAWLGGCKQPPARSVAGLFGLPRRERPALHRARATALFGTAVFSFFIGYRLVLRAPCGYAPSEVSPRCSCPGFALAGGVPIAAISQTFFIGSRLVLRAPIFPYRLRVLNLHSWLHHTPAVRSPSRRRGAACPPPAPSPRVFFIAFFLLPLCYLFACALLI